MPSNFATTQGEGRSEFQLYWSALRIRNNVGLLSNLTILTKGLGAHSSYGSFQDSLQFEDGIVTNSIRSLSFSQIATQLSITNLARV